MSEIASQVLLYLADFGKFAQKYLGNVGSAKLDYNWLVVLFVLFVIFLVGFSWGRSRMLLGLLSIYAAAFIEPRFIYFDRLEEFFRGRPAYQLHLGLFLAVYITVFALLNRSLLKHRLTLRESSFLIILSLSILELGFLAAIFLSYLPPEVKESLPSQILKYFDTSTAQFVWAAVPILALVFSGSKRGRSVVQE